MKGERQKAKGERLFRIILALIITGPLSAHAALTETQSFPLQQGWNAIFVTVQPDPDDPATVFAGLPVDAVWMWNGKPPGIDFSRDVTETLAREPGWLGHFPASAPHAFLSTLFSIRANRSYLVHTTAPAMLQITGRPNFDPFAWRPDSFNLAGFQVDPSAPPTFSAFLASSPAHTAQPIYTLDAGGTWRLVNAGAETITPGKAYWIFTRGASTYQAPVSITPPADGLEYDNIVTELPLTFTNQTSADATVNLSLLSSTAPVSLRYFNLAAGGQIQWLPLTSLTRTVRPGFPLVLRVAVARGDLTADRGESVLEVRTSGGGRFGIPVGATRSEADSALLSGTSQARRSRLTTHGAVADRFKGLWSGTATINKVSLSQTGGTTPLPAPSAFDMKLLLHVTSSSQVNLLKEVVQMFQEGTRNPDGSDATPGTFVLVTDDSALSQFKGAGLRDGVTVGKRLSTAFYDFPGHRLPMSGSFGGTGTVTATINLSVNDPTNPFRHRFHPDHDNLDPLFVQPRVEAYPVTREITLMFSATDPAGFNPPDFGESFLGGIYRERITGLHKNPIVVEGTFRIARISVVDSLRP